jgi:hypothetical protein
VSGPADPFPAYQHFAEYTVKNAACEQRAAPGATVDVEIEKFLPAQPVPVDPHLAAVTAAFPMLPDAIKAGTLAMVGTAFSDTCMADR